MKLTVFGPTGATGEQIVRQALTSGHEVMAVARRPEAVPLTDPRLRVVYGDVLNPASLHDGIVGADAVLSALGSRQMSRPTKVYSAGTAAVLAAKRDAGVRRFVGVTAVPVGPEDQKSVLERYLVHPLLHRFFGGGYDDMRRMEELLAESDLDWTVFRPPQLTNGPPTGRYRAAIDAPLPRAWRVSRADLAAAMLAAANDPALIGHTVTIAA
jgi:putative NADH-flavin reductase